MQVDNLELERVGILHHDPQGQVARHDADFCPAVSEAAGMVKVTSD